MLLNGIKMILKTKPLKRHIIKPKGAGKSDKFDGKIHSYKRGHKTRAPESFKIPCVSTGMDKKGGAAHYQRDYQIGNGRARITAIGFYNKDNEMLCADKDFGKDVLNKSWMKIGHVTLKWKTYTMTLLPNIKSQLPNEMPLIYFVAFFARVK